MDPLDLPSPTLRDAIDQTKHFAEAQRLERIAKPFRDAATAIGLANLVPNFPAPAFDDEVFESMQRARTEAQEAPTARRAIAQLAVEIRAFEDSLDDSHEVGVKLVPFGSGIVIHVARIGFHQPSLVILVGSLEDGSPVKVVQHLSQLNFLLVRAARLHPEEPKERIGFRLEDDTSPGSWL